MFVARADRPWFVVALLIVAGLAAAMPRHAPTPTYVSSFPRLTQQRIEAHRLAAQLRRLERELWEHEQRLEASYEAERDRASQAVKDARESLRRQTAGHGCILGRDVMVRGH